MSRDTGAWGRAFALTTKSVKPYGATSTRYRHCAFGVRNNRPSSAATRLIVFTLRRRPVRISRTTRNMDSAGASHAAYRLTRSDFAVSMPTRKAMVRAADDLGQPAWACAYADYRIR